jgi:SAM-dependent methyltransferase
LPWPDETFDFVYGNGVLHHVDIDRTVAEARRVLRPGGRCAFIEPLTYNPLIWLYRTLAKDVRTPDEHPLSIRQIRSVTRALEGDHREFWLSALAIFA